METTLMILLAFLPSLLCIYITYKITKLSEDNKKAEKLRQRESILILKNIDAIGTLSEKTVVCVKNGQVNGDLDKALEYRTQQKHALEDYLMEVNAMRT